MEEIIKCFHPGEAYFWATHNGAELDLLLFKGGIPNLPVVMRHHHPKPPQGGRGNAHPQLRQVRPWFENLGKRQVKAPKVYVRDSGLLHALLNISTQRDLEGHPKVGASWEGYAVEEIIKCFHPSEAYFWATHNGAELDLLLFKGGKRIGVECKRMDAPTMTPSIRHALTDLKLDHLHVVYPGTRRYALAENVDVLPLAEFV